MSASDFMYFELIWRPFGGLAKNRQYGKGPWLEYQTSLAFQANTLTVKWY